MTKARNSYSVVLRGWRVYSVVRDFVQQLGLHEQWPLWTLLLSTMWRCDKGQCRRRQPNGKQAGKNISFITFGHASNRDGKRTYRAKRYRGLLKHMSHIA